MRRDFPPLPLERGQGVRWLRNVSYGGSGHVYLQKHFSQHRPAETTYRKISLQLNRLRDLRVKADYQSDLPGTPEFLARSAMGMAKMVLECLDALSKQNHGT